MDDAALVEQAASESLEEQAQTPAGAVSGFKVNDIPDSSYRLIPDATKPAVIKYKPESVTADTGGWEAF